MGRVPFEAGVDAKLAHQVNHVMVAAEQVVVIPLDKRSADFKNRQLAADRVVSLENLDPDTALGQLVGGRETGDASADNRDRFGFFAVHIC